MTATYLKIKPDGLHGIKIANISPEIQIWYIPKLYHLKKYASRNALRYIFFLYQEHKQFSLLLFSMQMQLRVRSECF